MIKFLKQLFNNAPRSSFVGRTRTRDTNPVFSQRLIEQLPGAEKVIGQIMNSTVEASVSAGLTAFSGGGQGSATKLPAVFNRVTVSAATTPPYDSVVLPASYAGLDVVVHNATVNPIQVFGAGTDTVNGLASVTVPPNSIDFFICPVAGAWFLEAGIGYAGQLETVLAQDNITAHAGGGQSSATQLLAAINRVNTVATAGDSVMLPAAVPGLDCIIINHGANPMQVYGNGTDLIDDVATATGVSQMQNSQVLYTCASTGRWYSNGLATGFGGPGLETYSTADNITAHAGGGQGAATQLNSMVNRITIVATAGDSVVLPAGAVGLQITVINAAAANSMNVFPQSGAQINSLGANAAFAVVAGKTAQFTCTSPNQWHSILSA